ncbi:hypothetical protein L9F63_026935, partial [Diploptera punctata]
MEKVEEPSCSSINSTGKNILFFRLQMEGKYKQIVESISGESFVETLSEVIKEKKVKKLLEIWKDKVYTNSKNDLEEVIEEEKLDKKSKLLSDIKSNHLDNTAA